MLTQGRIPLQAKRFADWRLEAGIGHLRYPCEYLRKFPVERALDQGRGCSRQHMNRPRPNDNITEAVGTGFDRSR